MNVAINGFGRIGRSTFKALLNKPGIKVVAINDLTDTATLANLLKFDSCYGKYEREVKAVKDGLIVGGVKYPVSAIKDPQMLPWKALKVDVVIESTGIFTARDKATAHLTAGAKKVIITAPAKGGDVKTFVIGVNEDKLSKKEDIISMASCTTNCLAPVTEVIKNTFGIKKALMSTVHAYTADQNLVDGPHKDLRRGRSAAMNIVPTTTGAAIAVTETLPELKGKFDGMAIRVPVPTGSLSDMTFVLNKKVTAEEVNNALIKASKTSRLKGILTTTTDPIVSIDIVGNPASAIVDLGLTKVVDGDFVKVIAWYDNEWGYSNRLADLCEYINKKKLV
ncbi:MAG: type I glyceraldehyde-3-phosphate dehydrogenase [Patescibacteria group bacterium]|nr:type I glyceraldehyde-3-phosphate dehydrogenase [Patescibacteria group bacterium]